MLIILLFANATGIFLSILMMFLTIRYIRRRVGEHIAERMKKMYLQLELLWLITVGGLSVFMVMPSENYSYFMSDAGWRFLIFLPIFGHLLFSGFTSFVAIDTAKLIKEYKDKKNESE